MARRPSPSMAHFDMGSALKRANPGKSAPGFSEGVQGPVRFSSSNVHSATYDPITADLEVTFRNGTTYNYASVSADTWEKFLNADSAGKFLAQQIKGRHRATRL